MAWLRERRSREGGVVHVHVHVTRRHARMVADAEMPSSLRSEFYSEVQCAQYWPHSLTQSSSAMA